MSPDVSLSNDKIFTSANNRQDSGGLFWGRPTRKISVSQCLSKVPDAFLNEETDGPQVVP